jgi:transposase
MIKRIKNSVGSRKMVISRKKTGIPTEINSMLSDGSSLEHVVYNNSFELSAADLIAIKSIVKEEDKKILKWLNRPNYRLFAIKLNGEMVHFCLVIICKRGDSFRMADKDDLMIMTCHTLEKHRRKGLYKANLEYICSNWKVSKWAYIHTRVENIPSQKGIEAAGFERMGMYKCFRIGRFNLYAKKYGD